MGSRERKMEQESEKGREEVLRMGKLNWKEDSLVGLSGIVGGHFEV